MTDSAKTEIARLVADLEKTAISARLVVLYQQMADHTLPECRNTCRVPLSCCSPEYCELTVQYAQQHWNVELPRTSHPVLPLMGEHGCTAAPHLRPICTVHTCQVNSIGCKPGDQAWTERYFTLRDEIERLEYQREHES